MFSFLPVILADEAATEAATEAAKKSTSGGFGVTGIVLYCSDIFLTVSRSGFNIFIPLSLSMT